MEIFGLNKRFHSSFGFISTTVNTTFDKVRTYTRRDGCKVPYYPPTAYMH